MEASNHQIDQIDTDKYTGNSQGYIRLHNSVFTLDKDSEIIYLFEWLYLKIP